MARRKRGTPEQQARRALSARIKTKHPKVFKKEKIWYNKHIHLAVAR